MTKYKLSISVNEETLDIIQEKIREGIFRNRSHAFEYAIKKMSEGQKNE